MRVVIPALVVALHVVEQILAEPKARLRVAGSENEKKAGTRGSTEPCKYKGLLASPL